MITTISTLLSEAGYRRLPKSKLAALGLTLSDMVTSEIVHFLSLYFNKLTVHLRNIYITFGEYRESQQQKDRLQCETVECNQHRDGKPQIQSRSAGIDGDTDQTISIQSSEYRPSVDRIAIYDVSQNGGLSVQTGSSEQNKTGLSVRTISSQLENTNIDKELNEQLSRMHQTNINMVRCQHDIVRDQHDLLGNVITIARAAIGLVSDFADECVGIDDTRTTNPVQKQLRCHENTYIDDGVLAIDV